MSENPCDYVKFNRGESTEICPKCGLPKELCVCGTLEKETGEKIKVYTTKAKFKKWITVIEGINKKDIENVAKELKRKMACGGTVKDNSIILQGDHKTKIKAILTAMGYPEDNISVV